MHVEDEREGCWQVESNDGRIVSSGEAQKEYEMRSEYEVMHTSVYTNGSWGVTKEKLEMDVEAYSYTKFIIETGKKHQIRLHSQFAL